MAFSLRALLFAALLSLPATAFAHCQIPCGIFDDHARVKAMLENAATVAKAAQMISELAPKNDALSQNQLVRWVFNKEIHAEKIIETISDYFLTQRVKPEQADYAQRLSRHHAVMLAAMKAKQNTDKQYVDALKTSIEALMSYYPEHRH